MIGDIFQFIIIAEIQPLKFCLSVNVEMSG
jgi:hypothetical protein